MPSLFEMDIQKLKGVGEKRKKLFEKLGAPTVGDLLRLYPRAYEDWSQHFRIRDTVLNQVAVVKAAVLRRPTEHRVKGGKLLYKTTVTDGETDMALTFFNNKYIPTLLKEGETYLFRGKVTGTLLRREMLSPDGVTKARKTALEHLRRQYPGSELQCWREVFRLVNKARRGVRDENYCLPCQVWWIIANGGIKNRGA